MWGPANATRGQRRLALLLTVTHGRAKKVLLRLDPAVHDAVATWASDDLRSVNAQIEFVLRRALDQAGRNPRTERAVEGDDQDS